MNSKVERKKELIQKSKEIKRMNSKVERKKHKKKDRKNSHNFLIVDAFIKTL